MGVRGMGVGVRVSGLGYGEKFNWARPSPIHLHRIYRIAHPHVAHHADHPIVWMQKFPFYPLDRTHIPYLLRCRSFQGSLRLVQEWLVSNELHSVTIILDWASWRSRDEVWGILQTHHISHIKQITDAVSSDVSSARYPIGSFVAYRYCGLNGCGACFYGKNLGYF